MKETPFYFENNKIPVFGILHEPEAINNSTGFVFCYPLLEEKLWTQRIFVNFARKLSKRGFTILRFDYRGHGDSGGNFEETDIESRLSDIRIAIQIIKEKNPNLEQIGLVGLRFGATLAALTAEKENDINPLILWEPIIDGESYMQELLRINLTTQTTVYKEIRYNREHLINQLQRGELVNIDGYEINKNFYNQATKINLLDTDLNNKTECLIMQISRKPERIKNEYESLQNKYTNSSLKSIKEFPFWKEIKLFYSSAENLFNITLEWLENEK